MILDPKLNFQSHIKEAISKARRGIGLIRHISNHVSRDVLNQMYKLYLRPHLDYGDPGGGEGNLNFQDTGLCHSNRKSTTHKSGEISQKYTHKSGEFAEKHTHKSGNAKTVHQ